MVRDRLFFLFAGFAIVVSIVIAGEPLLATVFATFAVIAIFCLLIAHPPVSPMLSEAAGALFGRAVRMAFGGSLVERLAPRDVAASGLAFAIGGAAFIHVWSAATEPIVPAPARDAPLSGAPAPGAPTRYAGLLSGSAGAPDRDRYGRLSSQAPGWPDIPPETRWVPVFAAEAAPARKAASGVRLRGEQNLQCGFDRTAPGGPLRCQMILVAPIEGSRAPVILLLFDAGGVSVMATAPVEAVGFGAAPLTAVPDARWSWAVLGEAPARFRSLALRATDGVTFAVDLGERALIAAEIVTSRQTGARRERDEEARRRMLIRAARGFQRLGDASRCTAQRNFDFWRERTRPLWSIRIVRGAPALMTGLADPSPGGFGEPCVAAAFALRFIAGLGALR